MISVSSHDWDVTLAIVQALITSAMLAAVIGFIWWELRGRRPAPELRDELAKNLHDWLCDAGPWPHEGECVPADETKAGAWTVLAQCADRGYGRIPDDLATTAYGYDGSDLPVRRLRAVDGGES